jgi:hypothetical protein
MGLRVGEVWLSHSDRGCQYSAIVTRECSPHVSSSSHAAYGKAFEASVMGSNRYSLRFSSILGAVDRKRINTRGGFKKCV